MRRIRRHQICFFTVFFHLLWVHVSGMITLLSRNGYPLLRFPNVLLVIFYMVLRIPELEIFSGRSPFSRHTSHHLQFSVDNFRYGKNYSTFSLTWTIISSARHFDLGTRGLENRCVLLHSVHLLLQLSICPKEGALCQGMPTS